MKHKQEIYKNIFIPSINQHLFTFFLSVSFDAPNPSQLGDFSFPSLEGWVKEKFVYHLNVTGISLCQNDSYFLR